jgi:hypothetical protein
MRPYRPVPQPDPAGHSYGDEAGRRRREGVDPLRIHAEVGRDCEAVPIGGRELRACGDPPRGPGLPAHRARREVDGREGLPARGHDALAEVGDAEGSAPGHGPAPDAGPAVDVPHGQDGQVRK